jgi:DNA-binding PadR family transcriptional regulator
MFTKEEINGEAGDVEIIEEDASVITAETVAASTTKLTHSQQSLYEELARLSRQEGYAWISNQRLMEKYKVSHVTIIAWIKRLESMGLIRVERTRRSRKIFLLAQASQSDLTLRVKKPYSESKESLVSRVKNLYPNINTMKKEDKKKEEDIQRIFDAWREHLNHPNAKLDEKRRKYISARLKDFTADELCLVPAGAKMSAFHMGANDRRRKYDSIQVLFRDADQVEHFISLAPKPKKEPVMTDFDREMLSLIRRD